MDKVFSDKINILKALAIILVVSGHLEFRIFDMFPPYSFQLALFFFISGMLFKDKYLNNVAEFIKRRAKSLLLLYFIYEFIYIGITYAIQLFTGKFWGSELSFKNIFITPFLNGHQLDLICPMWFVPHLFLTLIVFLFLQRLLINLSEKWHLIFYTTLGFCAIPFSKIFPVTPLFLIIIRILFSLFFVYLGNLYVRRIRNTSNIFSPKIAGAVIVLQSILWLFNRDFDPIHGIGLSYVLVWARFDEQLIVPIFTSITGIWFSLFFVEITYNYIKKVKFIKLIGENTFHIMANHLLVMYIITAILLKLNGIDFAIRNTHNIYWIYNPIQTTYLYFIITIILSTGLGCLCKRIKHLFIRDNNQIS